MRDGWIAVYRSVLSGDHPLHPMASGQPACDAFAWIDLIGLARWRDGGGLKRGQVRASQSFLARRWNWSRSRVQRFLAALEDEGRTSTEQIDGRKPNIISICNFDTYQHPVNSSRTVPRASSGSQEEEEQPSKPVENKDVETCGKVDNSPDPLTALIQKFGSANTDRKPRPRVAFSTDDPDSRFGEAMVWLIRQGFDEAQVRRWSGRIPADRLVATVKEIREAQFFGPDKNLRFRSLRHDERKRYLITVMNRLMGEPGPSVRRYSTREA